MSGDPYSSRGPRTNSSRDYSSRDDRRGDRDRDRGGNRDQPRRRSRSPGGRDPRNPPYERDTYSSSRGHREREREDRYGDRERRGGDRAFDRDQGGRERRDRDGYDDRRGGARRDPDDFPRRGQKSPSPPRKAKEPTPDLANVVSIMDRRRRLTQWDIKPQGYEKVTAEQAKLSGMFPLPGAPRQQPMDPSRLQAIINQPANAATMAALKPTNSRQAKRMFVYNLPANVTDEQVRDFFNLQLNGTNVVSGRDPCTSANVAKDKGFALLEFRNAEDATLALSLDGLEMAEAQTNGNGHGGNDMGLELKRPKDYIAPSHSDETMAIDGQMSNIVPDTLNKICLTRMPLYIDDEQAKELLSAFGALKSFVLVKDQDTGMSRGVAFCEYVDAENATNPALAGLDNMELAEHKLKIFRACAGAVQVGAEMSVGAMSLMAATQNADSEIGRVICLLNAVTPEELIDNDEYQEICEDIKDECVKYGEVLELKIPRPTGGSRQSNGIGKIYIKYDTADTAAKAMQALAGRKFADRTVVVAPFEEELFDVNAW